MTNNAGSASTLNKDKARGEEAKIRELYLLAFAREPLSEETEIAIKHLAKNEKNTQHAYEDIVWALINTKEFLFNH